MNEAELLNWARGQGLQIALAIFVLGVLVRLIGIFALGRKADIAPAKGSAAAGGWRTVFTRSLPMRGMFKDSAMVVLPGYIFHLGFLITLVFFIPHIDLFHGLFDIRWPGLPTPLIDLVAIVSIAALIASLVHRLMHPVRRFLSNFGDYLAWTVTILPLITGYMAMHSEVLSYNMMLALHILSVELLLVVFPFTKLMHAFSFGISRWYQGAMAGRKGVPV